MRRSILFFAVAVSAAPFLAVACGGGDDGNANVPPSCADHLGSSTLQCPDASSPSDASISDAAISDAPVRDAAKDAGLNFPPPPPPACTTAFGLDTAFGTSGFAYNDLPTDPFIAAATQADGKVLVSIDTSQSDSPNTLIRLNANGTIDTSFGTGGVAATSGNPIGGLLVEPSGRIVAAAESPVSTSSCALTAFTPAGALDTTFGVNGVAACGFAPPIPSQPQAAIDFVVQRPNGKIVASADVYTSIQWSDFALVQFDTNGGPDTTFGNHGLALAGFTYENNIGSMLLKPDGKVILAGTLIVDPGDGGFKRQQLELVQFNEDGSLDATFGTGGISQPITLYDHTTLYGPAQMVLQSTGNIVIAVNGDNSNDAYHLLRVTPNGALDPAFGTDGVATVTFPASQGEAAGVSVYADDSLLTGGTVIDPDLDAANYNASAIVLAKLTKDGQLDTTFGASGTIAVNPPLADIGSGMQSQILQVSGALLAVSYGNYSDGAGGENQGGVLARFVCP